MEDNRKPETSSVAAVTASPKGKPRKREKTPEELAEEEAAKEAKRMEELRVSAEEAERRSRVNRWTASGKSRVTHPNFGSVIVPHLSKLAAIENAAEFWKCEPLNIIRDASVEWIPANDGPVRRPKEFYKEPKSSAKKTKEFSKESRTEHETQGGMK